MKDLFSLKGKTALITGASRGLGKAMAVALADAGAFVVCSSSKPGGAEDTVRRIQDAGGQAVGIAADLSDRTSVDRLFETAMQQTGRIDILVNNGGTIARYPAADFPMEAWDRVLEVNLTASFRLAQLAARQMMDKGGKIINIASLLSFSGGITVPAYTASKHAVAGITKALANEWAKYNIQVNAIAPGYFRTDNTKKLQEDSVRSVEISKRIPAERWGEPEDLAGAVVFLAAPASNYVNGTVLTVDGGWMAR
ncbi:MAG: glucose 1-dehydrogenase [Lewinellaceae bacterium]|nr:glucose 1-dehydrogenase [Lewinellaceae bacterium]